MKYIFTLLIFSLFCGVSFGQWPIQEIIDFKGDIRTKEYVNSYTPEGALFMTVPVINGIVPSYKVISKNENNYVIMFSYNTNLMHTNGWKIYYDTPVPNPIPPISKIPDVVENTKQQKITDLKIEEKIPEKKNLYKKKPSEVIKN